MSDTESEENRENEEVAEQGWKKIRDNDRRIKDALSQICSIRAETEEMRRENAKMFHLYKHKLGTKGNSILEKLYFHDYPTLEDVEKAVETQAAKLAVDYTDAELEKMTDDEIDKIVKSQKFFQTELLSDEEDDNELDPELASLRSSSTATSSARRKNKPKRDIIERNIRLAGGEGDILTTEERQRVEFILTTLDELDAEKDEKRNERLDKIDRVLESRFAPSNATDLDYDELSMVQCKSELEQIESRLAIMQGESETASPFRSSTILAIADIESGDDGHGDDDEKLLPRDQIRTLLANLEPTPVPISRTQIDSLLEQAKYELDL